VPARFRSIYTSSIPWRWWYYSDWSYCNAMSVGGSSHQSTGMCHNNNVRSVPLTYIALFTGQSCLHDTIINIVPIYSVTTAGTLYHHWLYELVCVVGCLLEQWQYCIALYIVMLANAFIMVVLCAVDMFIPSLVESISHERLYF
jgi:hypothetical protein